jgi:hypothetical protein
MIAEGDGESATDRLIEARDSLGKQREMQELAIVEQIRPMPVPVIDEARVKAIHVSDRVNGK